MPPQERSFLRQTAVLWPWTGAVDRYSEPVIGSPCELRPPRDGVSWVWKRTVDQDAQGNTIELDATVIATRHIPLNSLMWLGPLWMWTGTGSGVTKPDENLCIVKYCRITPDLKARHQTYQLGLMRFRNKAQ